MATGAVNPSLLLSGPGILYYAPLGTAEPTHTPAASKFPTAAWSTGWMALGSTEGGSEFSDSIDTDDVTVAESYYPVRIVTTGRSATWTTALAEVNMTNLKVALNGPTPTTSGTGATQLTTLAPPAIGAETRCMIGWQSEDDTVRFIGYQALQVGDLSVGFHKGADKATLSLQFRFEKPTSGDPYHILLAGATRGA